MPLFRHQSPPLEFSSERLSFKIASLSDAPEIFREFTPEVTRYMIPAPPQKIEDTLEFLSSVSGAVKDQLDYIFTVRMAGEFIGVVGFHERGMPRIPEIGVWTKRSAAGKHLGREAVTAVVNWAFNYFQIAALRYPVDRENHASRKIPESLNGFIYGEAIAPTQNGTELDEVLYLIPRPTPRIIGHRGAAGIKLENSRESIQAAIDAGVDLIECDLQLVHGRWIVFHDRTLDRVTQKTGAVADLSAEDIDQVLLKNGERLLELTELLELVPPSIGINLECKTGGGAIELWEAVRSQLRPAEPREILISSFDHRSIRELAFQAPECQIGVVYEGVPLDLGAIATDAGANTLILAHEWLTAEIVNDAHLRGVQVFAYTADADSDLARLRSLHVDGIITNFPRRF